MWHADAFAEVQPFESSRLHTVADAIRIVGDGLAQATSEILRLVHLDNAGGLIAIEEQHGGDDALSIVAADIVRSVCWRGTRQLLIAHNHPSGDPTPSHADRLATRRLAELLRTLDIAMVDHLVLARQGIASFRAMGLL